MASRWGRWGLAQAALWGAVVLLPFNDVPWFRGRLGELSGEGYIVGGAGVVLAWSLAGIWRGRVSWPRSGSAKLLMAWVAWVLLSSASSLIVWGNPVFKGRTLAEKVVLQAAVVVFVFCVTGGVYDALRVAGGEEVLRLFRRYVCASTVLPLLWAGVEVVTLLGLDQGERLLRAASVVIHSKVEYETRLRSVAGEASWFGVWVAFVLPWILSCVEKRRRWWGILVLLVVAIGLTFSRFAWLATLLSSGGFALSKLWLLRRRRAVGSAVVVAGLALIFGSAAAGTDWEKALGVLGSATLEQGRPHWISNSTRLGMQAAGIRIAAEYPVLGVGLGGYGFHFAERLPEWAAGNPEIEAYVDDTPGTPWPSVHGLWARMAAETGLPGLALLGGAWAFFLREAWVRARRAARSRDEESCGLWLALLWSAVGCIFIGFALDSLRFGGYWLLLGCGWAAMEHPREKAVFDAGRVGKMSAW